MAQQGFDFSRLTTGQKTLLIAGALFLIDLFLPWESVGVLGFTAGSISGFNGIGVLAGILVILLLVWEVMLMAGVNLNLNVSEGLVSAVLAGGTALFGLIRAIIAVTRAGTDPGIGAWLGIVLVIALAYGAWVRFNESSAAGTAPPPPPAA